MSKTRASKSSPKKEPKALRMSAESGSSTKPEMKTTEIRDLIDFIAKSGLNEVNIETKELKLHVKREPDQKIFKSAPASPPALAPQPAAVAPSAGQLVQQTIAAAQTPKAPEVSGKKTVEIKSPMTFTTVPEYSASISLKSFMASMIQTVCPFVILSPTFTNGGVSGDEDR